MCIKVKELGFPQNLGYNQLLYPQVATTKELLFLLVQKLPRQVGASKLSYAVHLLLSCSNNCSGMFAYRSTNALILLHPAPFIIITWSLSLSLSLFLTECRKRTQLIAYLVQMHYAMHASLKL